MQDDYSDILGSGTLNVKPQSTIPFGVKAAFVSFLLLVLYIIGMNMWSKFLQWRERSYRLAMRRKHGIPDDDHRPFNVAYAAVQRGRQEREALRSAKSRSMNNVSREQPRPSAQLSQDLRQRTGIGRNAETAWVGDRTRVLSGGYHQFILQNTGPGRYNQTMGGQSTAYLNEERVIYPRVTELVSHTNYPAAGSVRVLKNQKGYNGDVKRRNHVYMDIDLGKGTDGEALNRRPQGAAAPTRGSKREFGDTDETEDVLASKRAREKRARKVSLEKELSDEEMEVDENELEDGVDNGRTSRGKKRDRDEAGSTFGGDDGGQSELEDIQDGEMTRPRSRKRRTVVKKKSDLAVAMRGKKRDRDIDDELSDDVSDQASNQTSSRKRRNKREGRLDEYVNEDVFMNDSPVKGKSRKIGEEWTSNGVLYKIGPNGQRLRQTLVKKARHKYSMPQDSQHPDRDANLEVYIETWLTEDEYQDAKLRHLLAWQDTPKGSVERDAHFQTAQPLPSPSGKSLLWKATSAPPSTEGGLPTLNITPILKSKGRVTHDPRRQSISVDVAMRVNPFQQYPSQANRRIATGGSRVSSASGASSPGLVDSTNSSPRSAHRMYSKWEKQDLEANAMMKMREAARRKEAEEKERLEKERQEQERIEREKAEKAKAAAVPPVPTITITKPAEDEKPVQTEPKLPNFVVKPAEQTMDTTKPFEAPFSFVKVDERPGAQADSKAPAFPAPTPSAPITFAKPGPSPFMPPSKTTEVSAKPSEQGPKPSPFGMPLPSSLTTNSSAPMDTATPMFTFTKPAATPEQKKAEPVGQVNGGSLLSRLGPNTNAQSSTPPAFFKPTEAPKSFFNMPSTTAPAAQPQPAQAQHDPSTGNAAPLKFDFKVQSAKPTGTIPALGAPASSPAAMAVQDSAKAPASSPVFSFGAPTAPTFHNNAGAAGTTGESATSKFSFGVSNNSLGTGGASQPFSGVKGDSSSKSPFIFGGANPSASGTTFSGTGNMVTDTSSNPPVFAGSGSTNNVFGTGGTTTSFGMKQADSSKPLFSFDQTSTTAAPTTAAPTTTAADTSKALFDFGNNDMSKPTTTSKFAFNSLNRAGASDGAPTSAATPNPFITQTSTPGGAFAYNSTAFGSGKSVQPTFGSTAFGSGQSTSSSTTSSGQRALGSATSVPSAPGAFGSTTFATSPAFSGAKATAPGTTTGSQPVNQSPFGAPSLVSAFGSSTQQGFGTNPPTFTFGQPPSSNSNSGSS